MGFSMFPEPPCLPPSRSHCSLSSSRLNSTSLHLIIFYSGSLEGRGGAWPVSLSGLFPAWPGLNFLKTLPRGVTKLRISEDSRHFPK